MKTIQSILFLVFISGFPILMINSGRVSPQIEQQHNSYWTVIANAQSERLSDFDLSEHLSDFDLSEPLSDFDLPEPEKFSPPVGTITTRSTGYHLGSGRGGNTNRTLPAGNRTQSQNRSLNPLHSRIIQSTLQPMDLIISPEEAANYAATLDAKKQYVTKK